MIIRRKITAAIVALATIASLGACSTRPAANVMLLYYSAGAGEDKKFVQCVLPGKSGPWPVDDQTFAIETDTRTWNIAPEGGDSDKPIETGTKFGADNQPGQSIHIFLSADFVINRDCGKDGKDGNSPIVQFWEQIGRRYGISAEDTENGWNNDGWKRLLQATFVQALQKSLAEGTRFYTADQLESNGQGHRTELERRIAPEFQRELKAKLGGDFFCGVGYRTDDQGRAVEVEYEDFVAKAPNAEGVVEYEVVQRNSTCPPVRVSLTDVNLANADNAKARALVYQAEQAAKARLIEAQAKVEESRILSQAARDAAYLALKQIEAELEAARVCAANPNCTLIVGVGNTAVPTK